MKREIYKHKANKADLRNDLDRDIESFLAKGGRIVNIEAGETALESRVALCARLFLTNPEHLVRH